MFTNKSSVKFCIVGGIVSYRAVRVTASGFWKNVLTLGAVSCGHKNKAYLRGVGLFLLTFYTSLFPIRIGNFRIILKVPFPFMEQGLFKDFFFVFFHW